MRTDSCRDSSMSSDTPEVSPEPTITKPFFSRPVGKIFLIWLGMTIIGVTIGFYVPHHILPIFRSQTGTDVFNTVVLFTVLAAPVAAVVYGICFYSLIAWRYKGDQDEPPEDGPPLRGNAKVTTVWIGVSFFLVGVLLIWGLTVWSAQQVGHKDTLQVDVIGQQWLWTFKYPGTGVESHTLILPLNRPIDFQVTSLDVVHGFWIPNFGMQVDANPYEVTKMLVTPNRLGSIVVRCSNLCGLYHSFMIAPGKVVTARQFFKWLHVEGASSTAATHVAQAAP